MKSMFAKRLARLSLSAALLVPVTAAWAQWELDGTGSEVNFVSIKNDTVAEIHSFPALVGYVTADGKVQLRIDLDSVQTLIDIRNERMRETLFETVNFPAATVNAVVAPELLATVAEGGTLQTEVTFTLSLHGVEKSLTAPVVLVGEKAGNLQVYTPRPVLINAADFGLAKGIEALQTVAGLKAISTAVPVTVHLVFNRAQ